MNLVPLVGHSVKQNGEILEDLLVNDMKYLDDVKSSSREAHGSYEVKRFRWHIKTIARLFISAVDHN